MFLCCFIGQHWGNYTQTVCVFLCWQLIFSRFHFRYWFVPKLHGCDKDKQKAEVSLVKKWVRADDKLEGEGEDWATMSNWWCVVVANFTRIPCCCSSRMKLDVRVALSLLRCECWLSVTMIVLCLLLLVLKLMEDKDMKSKNYNVATSLNYRVCFFIYWWLFNLLSQWITSNAIEFNY